MTFRDFERTLACKYCVAIEKYAIDGALYVDCTKQSLYIPILFEECLKCKEYEKLNKTEDAI